MFIEFWAGLGLALLFHRSIAGKSIYRLGILIPMIVPPVVVGLIWKYLTYPGSGLVTYFSRQFLALFGLPAFPFFASSNTALATLIFVDVWQWTPFMFLILHAGLSSMPNEPYEAAEIDGASPLQDILDDHPAAAEAEHPDRRSSFEPWMPSAPTTRSPF